MTTFIIAEAGVNHNGDMELAHKLIDAAADAGADAVKFQTFRAKSLVTADAPKAAYQNETTGQGCQFDMLRKLELAPEDHATLIKHCQERDILFSSTPFDMASADLLDRLDVPFMKIPSGEVTNLPLVRHVAAKGRPVILSTGMSTLDEVERAVKWMENGPKAAQGLSARSVLHCVSAYPAPAEAINLNCIRTLSEALKLPIGYSDHSMGIAVPIAAVALGATIIEKHLTLDCTLSGPDHRASLEPMSFAGMVLGIRETLPALGDGIKKPAECELPNIPVVRRSIVAACSITKGEMITADMLETKRPGTGISPANWNEVIGSMAARNFSPDELIEI